MRTTIVTVAAALIATSDFAVAAETVEGCVQIENDLDRLACYDKASGRIPQQMGLPKQGAWDVRTEVSKLTDDTNVFLSVESDETVDCGWRRGTISLFASCRENTTSLIFNTGCHMTASRYSSYGDVMIRIDDEPARTIAMEESTNNRALGVWSGAKAIPVIRSMFGKTQLIARMTPYGQSPFTATFNIAGLEDASKPLREACRW